MDIVTEIYDLYLKPIVESFLSMKISSKQTIHAHEDKRFMHPLFIEVNEIKKNRKSIFERIFQTSNFMKSLMEYSSLMSEKEVIAIYPKKLQDFIAVNSSDRMVIFNPFRNISHAVFILNKTIETVEDIYLDEDDVDEYGEEFTITSSCENYKFYYN